jgi:uncharacterized protein (DUF3084 family)
MDDIVKRAGEYVSKHIAELCKDQAGEGTITLIDDLLEAIRDERHQKHRLEAERDHLENKLLTAEEDAYQSCQWAKWLSAEKNHTTEQLYRLTITHRRLQTKLAELCDEIGIF